MLIEEDQKNTKKCKENISSPNFVCKIILQLWEMFFHHCLRGSSLFWMYPSCVCHRFCFWEDSSVPPVSFLSLCSAVSILLYSSSAGFLKTWRRCWVVSSLSCNWCLCVTVKVFFKYSVIVIVCCVSGPLRGPDDVSENVLSSLAGQEQGVRPGRVSQWSLLAKTLPLLLGEASY